MENCLTTTLRGSSSAELRKLGEMMFSVENGTGSTQFVNINSTDAFHIDSTGEMFSDMAMTQSLGHSADFANNCAIYCSGGVVKVLSKYSIYHIKLGTNVSIQYSELNYTKKPLLFFDSLKGDIDSLTTFGEMDITLEPWDSGDYIYFRFTGDISNINKFRIDRWMMLNQSMLKGDIAAFGGFSTQYKQSLTGIETGTANVGKLYGNVEAFSDYVNMTFFNLNYIQLTGSLETALGKMTGLTLIAVGGHKQAEDLKNLFDTLYANGKRSGTIECWMGGNKTLNGEAWTDGKVTFTNEGWSKVQ